ncbi:MAG: hypothetical protein R2747_24915 [Pyrinomonadaceae bacterium]
MKNIPSSIFRLFPLIFLITAFSAIPTAATGDPENPVTDQVRPETLETREIEIGNCIQTISAKQFVITGEADYRRAIRNDASRGRCLEETEKIDFTEESLLGVEFSSGYCRRPHGLSFQTIRDDSRKKYILSVSYTDPGGQVCRALSRYALWVLVPKLPAGYSVDFEITARERKM